MSQCKRQSATVALPDMLCARKAFQSRRLAPHRGSPDQAIFLLPPRQEQQNQRPEGLYN